MLKNYKSSYEKLKTNYEQVKEEMELYQEVLLEIAQFKGPDVVKAPELAQKALFGSPWLKK